MTNVEGPQGEMTHYLQKSNSKTNRGLFDSHNESQQTMEYPEESAAGKHRIFESNTQWNSERGGAQRIHHQEICFKIYTQLSESRRLKESEPKAQNFRKE
jgi:hypothetical protein